jgi:hypothetical protein
MFLKLKKHSQTLQIFFHNIRMKWLSNFSVPLICIRKIWLQCSCRDIHRSSSLSFVSQFQWEEFRVFCHCWDFRFLPLLRVCWLGGLQYKFIERQWEIPQGWCSLKIRAHELFWEIVVTSLWVYLQVVRYKELSSLFHIPYLDYLNLYNKINLSKLYEIIDCWMKMCLKSSQEDTWCRKL